MKKIALSLVLTLFVFAAQAQDARPKFDFEATTYEFGTIKQGDVVEHTFSFTNAGKTPLVISNVKTTCGCTVPAYSKEPIAAGETGTIFVKFNSAGKNGRQNKVITITANTEVPDTRLTLIGEVKPAGDSK